MTPDIVYAAWYDSLLSGVKSSGSNIATIFANLDGTGRVAIAIVRFFSVPVGIIFSYYWHIEILFVPQMVKNSFLMEFMLLQQDYCYSLLCHL